MSSLRFIPVIAGRCGFPPLKGGTSGAPGTTQNYVPPGEPMRVVRILAIAALCLLPTLLRAEVPVLLVTLVPATGELLPSNLDAARSVYRFEVAAVGEHGSVYVSTHALVQRSDAKRLRAERPEKPFKLAVTGTIAIRDDGLATYEAELIREGVSVQKARGTVVLSCADPG